MPALLQTQTDACVTSEKGDLVSVEQALATGLAEAQPITETELVDLSAVTGRILAQPVKADAPLPRFDYSAMDGYALGGVPAVGTVTFTSSPGSTRKRSAPSRMR